MDGMKGGRTMVFRKAREEDLDAITKIYSDIHTAEENGSICVGWIRDIYPTKNTARLSLQRGDLFVAEDEGRVVGAAIINQQQVDVYQQANWKYKANDQEVMVLHTLVISPMEVRKGYGKRFVEFYEKYALSHHCRYLRMDTNEKNTQARRMYQKLGYIESDIIPCVFQGIEGVGLVMLEKRLMDSFDNAEDN